MLDLLLQFHVFISLVGIATGLVVFYGLLVGHAYPFWTALFLITTIATSVTGFPLPPYGFDAPRGFGVVSLVLLAGALAALYIYRLGGHWRWIYVATALAALYLNVFVAVVQSFQKLPFLQALAPTQSEPPFLITQLVVLIAFVGLGVLAAIKYRPVVDPRLPAGA